MVNKGRPLPWEHSPDDGDSRCRTVRPFRVKVGCRVRPLEVRLPLQFRTFG